MRMHHVQLLIPQDQEDHARQFYRDALGLTEVDAPAVLRGDGGCWFRSVEDDGTVSTEIHLATDASFVAASKAHPAFALHSRAEFDERAVAVADTGFTVSWAERDTLEGWVRFHCYDSFGNRVEVLASSAGAEAADRP